VANKHGLRLWRNWGSQRRFGFPIMKGQPIPKVWEDLHKSYLESKNYLYGVKKLIIQFSKQGNGNTGARHFHYYQVPALRYWNPDVEIHEIKHRKVNPPKVKIELENSIIREFDIGPKDTDADILKRILKLSAEKNLV